MLEYGQQNQEEVMHRVCCVQILDEPKFTICAGENDQVQVEGLQAVTIQQLFNFMSWTRTGGIQQFKMKESAIRYFFWWCSLWWQRKTAD